MNNLEKETSGPGAELHFEDYQALVASIAWRFTTYGVEFDELMSEGFLQFKMCASKWDPKRAKFSSYLYTSVTGRFKYVVARRRYHADAVVELDWSNEPPDTAGKDLDFLSMLKSLPSDAKLCAEVMLQAPRVLTKWLFEEQTKPKITRKHMDRFFNKVIGWPHSRFNAAWDTLKQQVL